jgi:hypothetical protein
MKWRSMRLAAAMLLATPVVALAAALTVPELERLLHSAPARQVAFEEERESPWLSSPVQSRGTMHSTAQALEKRVESPRRETWRLLPDRIEWIDAQGSARKEILFTNAPALAPVADLMRNIVGGELAALDKDFRIELAGDTTAWRMHLVPRQATVARALSNVELQGMAGRVQVIIVTEPNGQRTTTRLAY